MREAAALHREMEALEATMRQWSVETSRPYKQELARISSYFVVS